MHLYYLTVFFCGSSLAASLPVAQPHNRNTDQEGDRRQKKEGDAAILRLEKEVGENGYHYAYETSNDIHAEESGDTFQSRGVFAYRGDDGRVYSVTFTAGHDGFRAHGDHLPIPPPTPEEILLALKRNEEDEAAGIFDDGQYRPEGSEHQNGDSGYK